MKTKLNKPTLAGIGIACATLLLTGSLLWIGRVVHAQRGPEPQPQGSSSTDRIAGGRYFPTRLVWVGATPPSEDESQLLLEVLERWRLSRTAEGLTELDEFILTLTNSAWAPSLQASLGHYYRSRGQTTRALAYWQSAWERTKDYPDGAGKQVADFALANWTRLLMVFGRTDDLAEIYQTHGHRVLDRGPLSQMWIRTYEKHLRMLKYPKDSYKCGIYALDQMAQALKLKYRRAEFLRTPSKAAGFSMQELEELSSRYGFGLVPVRRLEGSQQIPVPSVVHWRQEHYAAIISKHGEEFQIADPSGLGVAWLTAGEINAEASGYFMVPNSGLSSDFVRLSEVETAAVVGRASSCPPEDGEDIQCDGGPAKKDCPKGNCGGMPTWRVSEPYLNVWIEDAPLYYQPAKGPPVVLELSWKQRTEGTPGYWWGVGLSWHCGWFSQAKGGYSWGLVEMPGGGRLSFTFPDGEDWSEPHYRNYSRLQKLEGGYMLHFKDGSRLKYAQEEYIASETFYQLSEVIDPAGHKLTLHYTDSKVTSITDADGNSTTLEYDLEFYPWVTKVTTPDGREAQLMYDLGGMLTNIVDAAGISSSLSYDGFGWVSALATPYGTTYFNCGFSVSGLDRWAQITEPCPNDQFMRLI